MKLTDATSGTTIIIPASSITSVREYPAGQTEVSTNDPSFPVLQVTEDVEWIENEREEETKP